MSFLLEFKEGVKVEDIKSFTPNCQILFIEWIKYCQKKNLPCKVTSLIQDRKDVVAKSKTHEQGRAWDASVWGWSDNDIQECVVHFKDAYKNIAALSYGDLKPRPVVYHDNHLHFQVRP